MSRVAILHTDHPQLGRFYAAIDPSARFTEPHCAMTRLGAVLTPFPDEETAQAALTAVTTYGQNGEGEA